MTIWGFLSVAAMAVLLAYWRKGPNAVWGTATVGAVIGVASYQPGFDWWTVGKAAVIGTFIGLAFELLPLVPRLWTTGSNARHRPLAEERHENIINLTDGQYEKKRYIALEFSYSLESCPKGIMDTALLSYPKQDILNAILLCIVFTSDKRESDLFVSSAIMLSYYQDDVGVDPIISPIYYLSKMELEEYILGTDFDRFDKLLDAVNEERDKFLKLIERAKYANLHLQPACQP